MSADDFELAERFLEALETAAETGDKEAVYPFLASDVEWVMPKRVLSGIDEIRQQLTWGTPPEKLDVEFEQGETRDLGDGRIVSDVHEVYRLKGTGDFAFARDRTIELTVRDGEIARYEMRIVG
jgi:ketosteroid isomerase-like protein